MISHTTTADDGVVITFYEIDGGPAKGPVIITSAGIGAADAAKRLASLSPAIRVFGFGFRGMGDTSGTGATPVTVERVARDLRAVFLAVSALTQSSMTLVGNSMGVNIIWRHADSFGEEGVERYCFIDQPKCVRRAFGGRDAIRGLLPVLRCAAWLRPLLACVFPKLKGVDFGALAHLIADSEATDNTERIPRCISRPCLLYTGEASFIPDAVAEARWIGQHVRGPARLLVYPKPHGTHSPQIPSNAKDPAAVATAARFCDDLRDYLLTSDAALYAEQKP